MEDILGEKLCEKREGLLFSSKSRQRKDRENRNQRQTQYHRPTMLLVSKDLCWVVSALYSEHRKSPYHFDR